MRQAAKIKQLECELAQFKDSSNKDTNLMDASMFESEQFRRDVRRNQELNQLIDTKNKDIIFLKEQLKPNNNFVQENKEMKETIVKLNQTIT